MTDSALARASLAVTDPDEAVEIDNELCFRAHVPLGESEQGISVAGRALIDEWVAEAVEQLDAAGALARLAADGYDVTTTGGAS